MFCSHHDSARNPFQCIVPDYLLDEMSRNMDRKIREAALRSMAMSRAFMAGRQDMARLARLEGRQRSLTAGKRRSVYTAENREQLRVRLVRGEGSGSSGDPAVDEVYEFFGNTYDFYKTVFHRNSIDNAGLPLIGTVHFGDAYNNAFWNGREMAFGDGDGVLFKRFTASLDVIGHELTHGVVEFNGSGGLEYFDQSGALNESCSDVFGVLVKQFVLGQNANQADWLLGEDILVSAPNLRSMRDPHDGFGTSPNGTPGQPKHMSEYDHTSLDRNGVHINSGIPNHAFYKFAVKHGGNAWERPGQIWYQTLTSGNMPSTGAKFQQFADETMKYAQDDAERRDLAASWSEVGITVTNQPPPVGPVVDKDALKRKLEGIRNDLNALIAGIG